MIISRGSSRSVLIKTFLPLPSRLDVAIMSFPVSVQYKILPRESTTNPSGTKKRQYHIGDCYKRTLFNNYRIYDFFFN